MQNPHKISEEDKTRIKELYEEGWSSYELAERFGVRMTTILYHLKKMQVPRRDYSRAAVLKHNKNLKLNKSPELAYLIGVYLGDGCVDRCKSHGSYKRWRFRVKVTEKTFIDSVAKACKKLGLNPLIFRCNSPYYFSNKQKWKIPYELVVYSEPFCLFMLETKDLRKLPKLIKGYEDAFLRGIYESEGSILHRNGRFCSLTVIANTNKELVTFVTSILTSMGFKYCVIEHVPKSKKLKTLYSVSLSVREGKKFLSKIKPSIKNLEREGMPTGEKFKYEARDVFM